MKSSAKKWSQSLIGGGRLREVLYQRRGLGKFWCLDKVLNKLIGVTGSLMRCGRTWKFDFSIKICHKIYPYGKLVEQ